MLYRSDVVECISLWLQRRMVSLCQACQDLILSIVTTEVQTYHVISFERVRQWHECFPLLVSQAEGVIT